MRRHLRDANENRITEQEAGKYGREEAREAAWKSVARIQNSSSPSCMKLAHQGHAENA